MIGLVLLSGGSSEEREVSILSTEEMLKHIDKDKYSVRVILIPEDGSNNWVRELLDNPPDIVLSGLHGGTGEDGTIQGLLECLHIPYVGSKVMSSALCMDKAMSKMIMKANHIPVIDGVLIRKNEDTVCFDKDILQLGFPLVVKPNKGGSSIGISIADNQEKLLKAMDRIRNMGDDILIEKYIAGTEVTCGIIETQSGTEVLTVLEIGTNNVFYDYDAKYVDSQTEIVFSTLPAFQQTMIKEIAKKVFVLLECAGYGRVDMMINEEQVYVLEMNTLPGLTSHSLIPKAASGSDISFGQFLDRIITFELERK